MKDLADFDKLDLEFIINVQDRLESYFDGKATEILLKSTFLDRIKDDPDYVYHYDEQYWAEIIKQEYESHKRLLQ